jgi:hypothetical protein
LLFFFYEFNRLLRNLILLIAVPPESAILGAPRFVESLVFLEGS